jgi:hypothetical protein
MAARKRAFRTPPEMKLDHEIEIAFIDRPNCAERDRCTAFGAQMSAAEARSLAGSL